MIQVRLSNRGIATLTEDPQSLIESVLGQGGLSIAPPATCSGTLQLCCPGGTPSASCGPIEIDLAEIPGDDARLEVTPQGGQSFEVVVRARLRSASDLPISVAGIDCTANIDSTRGANSGIAIRVAGELLQNTLTETTEVITNSIAIENYEGDDVTIGGGILCTITDTIKPLLNSTIIGLLETTVSGVFDNAFCKQCPSGTLDECGGLATECSSGVCQVDGQCLQATGIIGQVNGASILGTPGAGSLGAIEIYNVAGGYANTDNAGFSLGLTGGIEPSPTIAPCVPTQRVDLDLLPVPVSPSFQDNFHPTTGLPFDIAFGVHEQNISRFAWAAYESGFLCLDIDSEVVPLLTSSSLSLLVPSLNNLLIEQPAQIKLALRPSQAPTITLGEGGSVADPHLTLLWDRLDIEFGLFVDQRFIRLFTATGDVNMSIDVAASGTGISAVLLNQSSVLTNVTIAHSEPLSESPARLATTIPALFDLAIPSFLSALANIGLPTVGNLAITTQSVETTDNNQFLAVFANLTPVSNVTGASKTTAKVIDISTPQTDRFALRDKAERPTALVEVSSDLTGDYRYSYRINEGLWSPYTKDTLLTISSPAFWMQGKHQLEIRSRNWDTGAMSVTEQLPITIDTQPPHIVLDRTAAHHFSVRATDDVGQQIQLSYRTNESGAWIAMTTANNHTVPAADSVIVRATDPMGNRSYTQPNTTDNVGTINGTIDEAIDNTQPKTGTADSSLATANGCQVTNSPSPWHGGVGWLLALVLWIGVRTGQKHATYPQTNRRRRHFGIHAVLLLAILPSLVISCSKSNPCAGDDCRPGQVSPGLIGRYNSVVTTDSATIVVTYDQGLGDLVGVTIEKEGDAPWQETNRIALDGVPGTNTPVFDPSTYRSGITEAGDNVGLYASATTMDGNLVAAYRDATNDAVKFGSLMGKNFLSHTIQTGDGTSQTGSFTSVACADNQGCAVAFLSSVATTPANQQFVTELTLATTSGTPVAANSWSIQTLDSAQDTCASRCVSGQECIEEVSGDLTCVAPQSGCTDPCTASAICHLAVCTPIVQAPEAIALPGSTGQFAQVAYLPDGRVAVAAYHKPSTSPVLYIYSTDTGNVERIVIDSQSGVDLGRWLSMQVRSSDIHFAYQDRSRGHLRYTKYDGQSFTQPTIIDDGTDSPQRPYTVGANARLFFDEQGLSVLYQNQTTSDVRLARSTNSGWEISDLLSGVQLDGFFIDVAVKNNIAVAASLRYDLASSAISNLLITAIP